MIKRKGAVRLVNTGNKLALISRRKDGNLGKSDVGNQLSTAMPLCAADDAITLYDGKILLVTKGNLTICE